MYTLCKTTTSALYQVLMQVRTTIIIANYKYQALMQTQLLLNCQHRYHITNLTLSHALWSTEVTLSSLKQILYGYRWLRLL